MMLLWRFLYWAAVALFIFAVMIAVIICSAAVYWAMIKILRWLERREKK